MRTITIRSPAKLNLHLRILGKRPDGYHNLLTIFHRISLADTIRIQKKPKGFKLTTNVRCLETGEDNLITKAYRTLQKEFPALGGAAVRLTKRIPMGGGLGGGSSNAAFFLLGMKKLFQLKISFQKLLLLGKKIGADVPFFLLEAPQALAWGIGDKMKVTRVGKPLWFLLLVSEQGLNTQKVYQTLSWKGKPLSLTKEKRIARILRYFLGKQRIREAAELVRNDLESSAFCLRPSIPKAIAAIQGLGTSFVRMTGSGPTVFAVFSSQKEVRDLSKKLKRCPIPFRKVICHSF
ncbi:MAG TPA: 4-(cytidine 5'-diphospho)-2-C-methyl-D-erythritol kinase [Candidatus Omnitrophota bacterium]|nr:4-(cytidine 5'-diphospho)-2-C-methyl-D-erythritol kinase [Candidatus Omnitrophota bacterium]